LAGAQTAPAREDLARIELVSPAQLELLDQRGVAINDVRAGHCIVEAAPELLAGLAHDGFAVTVLKEDISGEHYRNFQEGLRDGQYLTYEAFVDTMNTIAVNNPGVCKLETLATTTSTNRKVLVMKVSDNPRVNEPEPAIIWDGNTHGDEKIAWAVAFEFLKYLLRNYGSDPEITALVDSREIWICPMFNPDGYVSSSRYNGRSVDMNRNWGWMWGRESRPGVSVMSENEVSGLVELLWREPVSIWVSYHAGTEAISYPWSYTDYDSIIEKRHINWLSQAYHSRGNSYEYGQGSIIMYYIYGSSKDLGYGGMGAMSWSIEVHYTKTPAASEIDPTFNRNRDAMVYFTHATGFGIHGTVTDSATGLPVRAQVWLQPYNWPSYSERTNGDFHRFALPGTYGLTVRAPGYLDRIISDIVVPGTGDSSVTVNVTLTPSSSAPLFGFQMAACSAVTITSNRTYPVRALGVHDGVGYQLDNNIWIVIDMDQPLRNGPGNDLSVYRSSGTANATVMAANTWKGPWSTVGTTSGSQTDFDLGAVSLDSARYIRVKASGGQFVLDAVEGIAVTGVAEHAPVRPAPRYELAVRPGVVGYSARVTLAPAAGAELALNVRDAAGRLVRRLNVPAGANEVRFEPRTATGARLAAGVYFLSCSQDAGGSHGATRFVIPGS
jgi:hypothetical protein